MYFWIDKKFFYVLFVERALLVHKTVNFNQQNISCSSSTLLRRQFSRVVLPPLAPPGKRARGAAETLPPAFRHQKSSWKMDFFGRDINVDNELIEAGAEIFEKSFAF